MAVHTPGNIYSEGAVVFNNQPYVAYATNMLAHKAAKDEALDTYYRDLNKSINPAGVRNQDMGGFMQKTNELQGFYQQNRDAIKNPRLDNGKAQTEYNSRYQDALGYINQSKQEELKKKPFVDIISDPNKRERVTDKMINDIHLHDLPLNDPNRKSFDVSEEEFNPQPFEVKDWQDYYKNVGAEIKPDKNEVSLSQDPNDKFSRIETTTARYSQPKLRDIGDTAKNDYYNSNRIQYSFGKAHPFKEWTEEHPEQFNTLSDIYKQTYGKDAQIQDDADLHAAIVLQKKIEPTSTSKRVDNWEAKNALEFQQRQQMQQSSQNFQSWLKKQPTFKESQGQKDDIEGLGNVFGEVSSIVNNPARIATEKNGNYWELGDPTILKAFAGLDPKSSSPPNSIKYDIVHNKMDIVYLDKDGKESHRIQIDPKTYLKAKVKQSYPNKDIATINNMANKFYDEAGGTLWKAVKKFDEINKEVPIAKPTTKKQQAQTDGYTKAELKAAGWSEDQINNASKSGKIKLHD